jgi:hypothetical protein
MESVIAWLLANLGGLIKDLILTTISVMVGYWLSVRWSRREARELERAEKEALMRNIAFFVNDCRIAIRDATENIQKKLPPYRSVPCIGIEHFQENLMRFGENEVFVSVSTLRSVIEQVNFLMPTMAQQFVASRTDQHAAQTHLAILDACYNQTLKTFSDIELHCQKLGVLLESKLSELKN